MSRILVLADATSEHTLRFVRGLSAAGFELAVFSLLPPAADFGNTPVHCPCRFGELAKRKESSLSKLRYLTALPALVKLLASFRPGIVHAHYASSYGALAFLSGFRPYVLSVWGDDVFVFPRSNPAFRALIQRVMGSARRIFSTSDYMAREVSNLTTTPCEVIPFGIDTDAFCPGPTRAPRDHLVIGTLKTLAPEYGIDVLIHAFGILRQRCPERPLQLHVYGGGPQHEVLRELAAELGLEDGVTFFGRVPSEQLVAAHRDLDIYVSVSRRESFGVAALEASACGRPVVASDIGGFREIMVDGQTGLLVPVDDPEALADALARLVREPDEAHAMGRRGRAHVLEHFDSRRTMQRIVDRHRLLMETVD